MSDPNRCPDCGHENPAGSESCSACNFPLRPAPPPPAAVPEAPPAPEPAAPPVRSRPPRPIRPRRPRPGQNQALTLWLAFGAILAVMVIYIAIQANVERASVPVEGASTDQQQQADQIMAALAKDSTDVEARVALADLLFDTGNWPDAIIQYRAVLRRDTSRVTAIVDLGVCYYNLGDPVIAEQLFERALRHDPHQPVALFNLGIVHERRKDDKGALSYFHRALQSSPPESMRQPLMDAIARAAKNAGIEARPLPQGR